MKPWLPTGGVVQSISPIALKSSASATHTTTWRAWAGHAGAPLALADQLKNCTAEINSTEGNKTFKAGVVLWKGIEGRNHEEDGMG